MRRLLVSLLGAALLAAPAMAEDEGPSVSFSGMLDADVWTDFTGKFYTNSELDLGMTAKFNDAVSAHVYATVNSMYAPSGGRIPAGTAAPNERWIDFAFDGFDIEYATKFGTFTAGDLVYQFGKFNYYFYKRLSMITPESFTRGLKYSLGNDMITQTLSLGVADANYGTGDVVGTTLLSLGEDQSVEAYYGVRGDVSLDFKSAADVFVGAEYKGAFGPLSVKADVGYKSLMGEDRSSTVALLLEPTLALGKFSIAASVYAFVDPDSTNYKSFMDTTGVLSSTNPVDDEMVIYVEPGVSVTDNFGIGLPLELHDDFLATEDDMEFWAVPTFYIYPTDKVQWWIWGSLVQPLYDADPFWGLGSEIIVNF
uniref:Porin n=1 Tax=Anaerolinea thermolimosa TaxID=229919 RepID=A0A7C4KHD6_9CHLR